MPSNNKISISTMIAPAKRLEGIGEYYFSQKLREIDNMIASGKEIINLGIGSPDLPPPAKVVETLTKYTGQAKMHGYASYKGLPELRLAIAEFYREKYLCELHPDKEILPLMGSKEGIVHLSMALLNAGDTVLVPNPGYPAYAAAAQLAGAQVQFYHLSEDNDWQPDFTELRAIFTTTPCKIIWLNYPHMPTGAIARKETFRQLIALAQEFRVLLCHDNPYSMLSNGNRSISLLSEPGAMDVAVELNSMSKTFNMAGWRIGWMAGREDILRHVLRFKSNMDSGMFKPIQYAAAEALHSGPEWYAQLHKTYAERRQKAIELLINSGCKVAEGQQGMFVWGKVPNTYSNGFELSDYWLQQSGIFAAPGGIFGSQGNQYIRISLCQPVDQIEYAKTKIEKNQTTNKFS
jgi:LL-diaminopimelate aminotransferase